MVQSDLKILGLGLWLGLRNVKLSCVRRIRINLRLVWFRGLCDFLKLRNYFFQITIVLTFHLGVSFASKFKISFLSPLHVDNAVLGPVQQFGVLFLRQQKFEGTIDEPSGSNNLDDVYFLCQLLSRQVKLLQFLHLMAAPTLHEGWNCVLQPLINVEDTRRVHALLKFHVRVVFKLTLYFV